MSLVKQRHIILAASAILAIWLPLRLANPTAEAPPIAGFEPVRAVRVKEPSAPQASIARAPFTDPAGLIASTEFGVPGEPGGSDGAAPLPPLPPPPQLVGTAMGPRGKAVALVRSASGAVETLTRGEAIDGWTLAVIGRGQVRFTQRGETRVAELATPNAPASATLASSSQDISQ